MNGEEWEEEQVRLDRDWYSHDDEGAVVSRPVPCTMTFS
jgi:pre-mRNA-splicing factor ATP-dependent RNA helicase DHX38/PRP16